VFVVDDDISVWESLIWFEGWEPETFASAQEFLSRAHRSLLRVAWYLTLPARHRAQPHCTSSRGGDKALRDCCSSLSHREREVALVVSGLLNKRVGGELGISEITVKAHSLADLVLGLASAP
jgi:FixJ family two-component response regulator